MFDGEVPDDVLHQVAEEDDVGTVGGSLPLEPEEGLVRPVARDPEVQDLRVSEEGGEPVGETLLLLDADAEDEGIAEGGDPREPGSALRRVVAGGARALRVGPVADGVLGTVVTRLEGGGERPAEGRVELAEDGPFDLRGLRAFRAGSGPEDPGGTLRQDERGEEDACREPRAPDRGQSAAAFLPRKVLGSTSARINLAGRPVRGQRGTDVSPFPAGPGSPP